jgi:DNA-binding GntR family transcriptional regulator
LEVRLDQEHRLRLVKLAEARGASVSEVVRQLIDQAYEGVCRAERLRAVQALAELSVEDVPDLETLRQQLDSAYESPDLY